MFLNFKNKIIVKEMHFENFFRTNVYSIWKNYKPEDKVEM